MYASGALRIVFVDMLTLHNSRSLAAALLISCGWLAAACNSPAAAPAADSWTGINARGETTQPGEHACVLDSRTGLMWEVKHGAPGLHYHGNTYTWFSADRTRHMTVPGTREGGDCLASGCDTEAFVAAVNEARLCGYDDWYLPPRNELMTLGDPRLVESGLVLDRAFFPHATAREYWASETFRLYPDSAWVVDTGNGLDRVDMKQLPKAVRVVRRHQPPAERDD